MGTGPGWTDDVKMTMQRCRNHPVEVIRFSLSVNISVVGQSAAPLSVRPVSGSTVSWMEG